MDTRAHTCLCMHRGMLAVHPCACTRGEHTDTCAHTCMCGHSSTCLQGTDTLLTLACTCKDTQVHVRTHVAVLLLACTSMRMLDMGMDAHTCHTGMYLHMHDHSCTRMHTYAHPGPSCSHTRVRWGHEQRNAGNCSAPTARCSGTWGHTNVNRSPPGSPQGDISRHSQVTHA